MNYGLVVQLILVGAGVFVLILTIMSLAKKKLEVNACLTWGLIAIVLIIAGIVLRPNGWIELMSTKGLILLVIIGLCVFAGIFSISSAVSVHTRKINELSMQVSLLNHEIEDLQAQIDELEKKIKG
ncbi:MAG: DUF2304 domain-containing protein [Lachnospiraceae bacterium]|nr:DUF2304 domain-containing protein [Lachnospiraceae bacterium]